MHSVLQEHLTLLQSFEVEVVMHDPEEVDLFWREDVLRPHDLVQSLPVDCILGSEIKSR